MAPKNRVIIDTDPGCDDVLALLLALSASSEELEVPLITITHGNVDVRACLKNAVATFHVLDREIAWRRSQNLPLGFDGITKFRPVLAVGAEEPLHDKFETADYFHGRDGLAGSHATNPHFTPEEGWLRIFEETLSNKDDHISRAAGVEVEVEAESQESTTSYTPSRAPAHKEILRVLRENEPDTITLVSLGPLTNFALAAAEDPETFLRAKELVAMGGAVDCFGNVTPVAEFNVFADPVAAARVFALSSQVPSSTMPAIPSTTSTGLTLPSYEHDTQGFSRQLRIVLMSLDITEYHALTRRDFNAYTKPLLQRGSPLAQFLDAFMTPMLDKMESLHLGHEGDGAALSLHDPLTIWYVLTQDRAGWKASEKSPEDIRVETLGQWTRGMTVGDRRLRRRRNSDGVRPHDRGNWLGNRSGNRVLRMLESPGRDLAGIELMDRILGVRTE